jgi:hypothetical protein
MATDRERPCCRSKRARGGGTPFLAPRLATIAAAMGLLCCCLPGASMARVGGPVRAASGLGEQLAASSLLREAFDGGPSTLARLVGLRFPGLLEANVFFSPSDSEVGVVLDDAGAVVGCVQLVRVREGRRRLRRAS